MDMMHLNPHEELEEMKERCATPENVVLMAALKILDDGKEKELNAETARRYVAGMKDADGHNVGETWSYQTIRDVLAERGIDEELLEMYIVMNMIKADFGRAMSRNGVNNVGLVIEMARDWLHDPDAKPGKLKRYMKYISA